MNDILNKCLVSCFACNDDVSLYIHIPFCRAKCAYCGFYSVSESKVEKDSLKNYFHRLISEAKEVKEYFKKPFKTIYIGGGTPLLNSHLPYIIELLDVIDSKNSSEVTLEANACNLTENEALVLNPYFTRLSVGIQSFDKNALSKMGRFYTSFEDIKRILTFFGDKEINFDFISTPFEDDIKKTSLKPLFEFCAKMKLKTPEHLSLYLLSIEDGTKLKKRMEGYRINDDNESVKLKNAWNFLENHDYVHYEVSAFGRKREGENLPFYTSSHNLRYWMLENYIGLGASASSHSKKGYDIVCSSDYRSYANGKLFDSYEIECLSKENIAIELILTHLRTVFGLDKNKFNTLTGFSLDRTVEKASRYCEKNHNILDYYKNGILALSPNELLFSDFYINLLTVCLSP